MENEQQDFVEKINSTEKKLGNNKFQEQIEKLKKEIEEYENKTKIDKETNDNLQKKIDELQDNINHHNETINKLQTQIADNTNKDKIELLERQLDLKDGKIAELNETIQRLNISIDDITKSKTIVEDELQKLQTHYTDFQSNFNKFNEIHENSIHKIEEQQNHIKSLQDNISINNNEIQKLEDENNFLKNELDKFKSNYTNLEMELEERFESLKQEFLEKNTTIIPNISIQTKVREQPRTRGMTRSRK